MNIENRDSSLDIIRIFAFLCVVSVHFFLHSGYYNVEMSGKSMLVMTVMRTFFMICVPLFMTLSGYLLKGKTLCKKYYKGLIKTYVIYLFASGLCLLFKTLYLKETFTVFSVIKGVLNFSLANYAWYVEMYIGLFLIVPFFNLAYGGLRSDRQKNILVLTFALLTALPPVINIYFKILPEWWTAVYPITYYFIGCRLSEIKIKIKPVVHILLFALSVILFGSIVFLVYRGKVFGWGEFSDYGSVFTLVICTLTFSLLMRLPKIKSVGAKKFLMHVSDCCLGAYLVSYVFDMLCYPVLNSKIKFVCDKLPYYFVIVPIVFVCSLAVSGIMNLIYSLIFKKVR